MVLLGFWWKPHGVSRLLSCSEIQSLSSASSLGSTFESSVQLSPSSFNQSPGFSPAHAWFRGSGWVWGEFCVNFGAPSLGLPPIWGLPLHPKPASDAWIHQDLNFLLAPQLPCLALTGGSAGPSPPPLCLPHTSNPTTLLLACDCSQVPPQSFLKYFVQNYHCFRQRATCNFWNPNYRWFNDRLGSLMQQNDVVPCIW